MVLPEKKYFPLRIVFITKKAREFLPLFVNDLIHLLSTVSTKKLRKNMRFTQDVL